MSGFPHIRHSTHKNNPLSFVWDSIIVHDVALPSLNGFQK